MELILVLVIGVLAIGFALFPAQNVLTRDTGSAEMQTIPNALKEGAEAFLARQNKTIGMLATGTALLLFALYAFLREQSSANPAVAALAVFYLGFCSTRSRQRL